MQDRPYRKYLCNYCGMIYDEEFGLPEDGLPPGTRFEDIPDDWYCLQGCIESSGFSLIE